MEEEFEIEEESVVVIAGSELLQSGTYFSETGSVLNGEKLSDIIGNTILKDGKDGVYDGDATVIYKDAKQFGEVVKIDGSIFRVTGVTRKKEGRPITDFNLMEVR